MEEKETEKTLTQTFLEGWTLFRDITNSDEPSNSNKYKAELKRCQKVFIQCTHMVNQLLLFSPNEIIDEVSTANIKFLLLPAFLGDIYLKEISDVRKSSLDNALIYFRDYLKRCHEYMVVPNDLSSYYLKSEESQTQQSRDINDVNKARQQKIQRYKENKLIASRIDIIESRLKKDENSVDDETVRSFYLDWLKLWINNAIENIGSMNSELPILEHMSKIKKGEVKPPEEKKKLEPMKPILITREMLQKKVFGAGYKSLPTMTENEYFEKELREGKIIQEYEKEANPNEKSDEHSSDEDDEKLKKARDWDDWKDTHRRGEGNKEQHG